MINKFEVIKQDLSGLEQHLRKKLYEDVKEALIVCLEKEIIDIFYDTLALVVLDNFHSLYKSSDYPFDFDKSMKNRYNMTGCNNRSESLFRRLTYS